MFWNVQCVFFLVKHRNKSHISFRNPDFSVFFFSSSSAILDRNNERMDIFHPVKFIAEIKVYSGEISVYIRYIYIWKHVYNLGWRSIISKLEKSLNNIWIYMYIPVYKYSATNINAIIWTTCTYDFFLPSKLFWNVWYGFQMSG